MGWGGGGGVEQFCVDVDAVLWVGGGVKEGGEGMLVSAGLGFESGGFCAWLLVDRESSRDGW